MISHGGVLSGKAALVTGGSGGIGQAIVRRLNQDGCRLAFTFYSDKKEPAELAGALSSRGREVIPIHCDLGDPETAVAAVREAHRRFQSLDIVINNAGALVVATLEESRLEDVRRVMDVNAIGPYIIVREAARYLPSGGRVVNVGSVGAQRARRNGLADYAASKAALGGFTRGWARDLGPRGVTVNAVDPGFIKTDMMASASRTSDETARLTALGRHGNPNEVAAAVAFLASSGASYITGTTITVDGGLLA